MRYASGQRERVAWSSDFVVTNWSDIGRRYRSAAIQQSGSVRVVDASIVMLSQLRWPDAGLVSSNKPLTLEPIGVAVPAGDPLLLNLVENYMDALIASGALEQLKKKWFENGGWLMQLP